MIISRITSVTVSNEAEKLPIKYSTTTSTQALEIKHTCTCRISGSAENGKRAMFSVICLATVFFSFSTNSLGEDTLITIR